MMATLRRFMLFLLQHSGWSAISRENRDPLFRITLKTWNTSAPFPKVANHGGSTYANFGSRGALATLFISGADFDLKFLPRARGTRCRNFKSTAPGRAPWRPKRKPGQKDRANPTRCAAI